MAATWKKGRGKLGFLNPLLGEWVAEANSPMGKVRCERTFAPAAGGAWVGLDVRWTFEGEGAKPYSEHAVIGVDAEGIARFWSFTSDGKRSEGLRADVSDLHPEAIGFEAQMPAGLARFAYWPEGEAVAFVVEAKTKKGWSRMVDHGYRRREP